MASYSFSILDENEQHKYTEKFSIRTCTRTKNGDYSFQSVGESDDPYYGPNGYYETEIEQIYIIENSGSVFLLPEVFFFHLYSPEKTGKIGRRRTGRTRNATDLTFYNEAYILDILDKARKKLKYGGKLFHSQLQFGDRYISQTVYVDDDEETVFDLKSAAVLDIEISELKKIIVPLSGWKQWVKNIGSSIGQAVIDIM
jgi:hypothetical protein